MALVLDPARLLEPLSDGNPCGDDLDETGDLDFLNRVSHVESLLPASFFVRDDEGRQQPFDRASIDFARESKGLVALLERTRDLRILALLARLAMLDRDLPGFASALNVVAGLLETQWEAVHPRGDGGGYELRGAILQSIEDVPTVILPLQHIVLAQSRRYGAISFRSVMTADGEVPPREDEPVPDRTSIERAIEEADAEALGRHVEALTRADDAIRRIAAVTVERGGYGSAVDFDRLKVLVGRIRGLLERSEPSPQPAADDDAPVGTEASHAAPSASPRPAGGIASAAQASAALAAAALYLRSREPSSPAEVLVRQAQMLVGKSFLEVMRILVPAHASDAVVAIGANRGLRLTFDQLSSVPEESAGESGGGWDETREDEEAGQEPDAAQTIAFSAGTRAEAMALLREVGAFFRSHEPSSPIPLLLEKAVGIADRDFLSILRDVLPDLTSE